MFGSSNTSSVFGSTGTTFGSSGGGFGAFGSSNKSSGGLFGSSGGSTNNNTTATSGFGTSSLFGSSANTNTTNTISGFGSTNPLTSTNTNTGSSLFGSNTTNSSNANIGGLFGSGSSNVTGNANPTGQSIFGGSANASASTGSSLFGGSNAANTTASGFGGIGSSTSGGLFGSTTSGGFGSSGSTTNTAFGFGGLSGSVSSSNVVGTTSIAYRETPYGGTGDDATYKYVAITAMPEYEKKSLEQLRLEDYKAGNTGLNINPSNTLSTGTGSSLFGTTPSNAGGFFNSGTTSTTPATTSNSLFGGSQSTGLFGASTTSGGGGGLFGSSSQSTAAAPHTQGFGTSISSTPGSLFGGNTSTGSIFGSSGNTGTSLFGSSGTTNTGFGSSGLFGSTGSQAAPAASSIFGTSTTATTPTTSSGGLFDNANKSTSFGTSNSLFGSSSQTSQGTSLFGNTGSNTQGSGTGLFGSTSSGVGGGLFGSNSGTGTNTGTSLFGSSNPTNSLFGNTNTMASNTGSSLFGTVTNNNASQGLFGNTTSIGGGGGLFGNSGTSGSLFGTTQTAPQQSQGTSIFSPNPQTANVMNSNVQNPGTLTENILSSLILNSFMSNNNNEMAKQLYLAKRAWQPTPNANINLSDSAAKRYKFNIFEQDATTDTSSLQLKQHKKLKELERASLKPRLTLDSIISSPKKSKTMRSPQEQKKAIMSGFGSASLRSTLLTPVKPMDLKASFVIDKTKRPKEDLSSKRLLESPTRSIASLRGVMSQNSEKSESKYLATGENGNYEQPLKQASKFCPVLSKELENLGYYTRPSVEDLSTYTEVQLKEVENFEIIRHGYGSISWIGKVDVTNLVIDKTLVSISDDAVEVYKDGQNTPPVGEKLNRPAIIRIFNVKKPIEFLGTDEEFIAFLRDDFTKSIGGEFIEFKQDKTNSKNGSVGTWGFKVEHFTKYGLTSDGILEYNSRKRQNISHSEGQPDCLIPTASLDEEFEMLKKPTAKASPLFTRINQPLLKLATQDFESKLTVNGKTLGKGFRTNISLAGKFAVRRPGTYNVEIKNTENQQNQAITLFRTELLSILSKRADNNAKLAEFIEVLSKLNSPSSTWIRIWTLLNCLYGQGNPAFSVDEQQKKILYENLESVNVWLRCENEKDANYKTRHFEDMIRDCNATGNVRLALLLAANVQSKEVERLLLQQIDTFESNCQTRLFSSDFFTIVRSVTNPATANMEQDMSWTQVLAKRLSSGHCLVDCLNEFRSVSDRCYFLLELATDNILSPVRRAVDTYEMEPLSNTLRFTLWLVLTELNIFGNNLTPSERHQLQSDLLCDLISNEEFASAIFLCKAFYGQFEQHFLLEILANAAVCKFGVVGCIEIDTLFEEHGAADYVLKAKAIYSKYKGNLREEVAFLLASGQTEEWHFALVKYLLPTFLANSQEDLFAELVDLAYEEGIDVEDVSNWDINGSFFAKYAKIKAIISSTELTSQNAGNLLNLLLQFRMNEATKVEEALVKKRYSVLSVDSFCIALAYVERKIKELTLVVESKGDSSKHKSISMTEKFLEQVIDVAAAVYE